MGEWKNRIVGHGFEDPEQLLANPFNFRIHSQLQQNAMEAILDDVGWVGEVKVNRVTGHIVDGHMRVSLALKRGEKRVPVEYVELSEKEEFRVLATYDPIGAMASVAAPQYAEVLEFVNTDSTALQQAISEYALDAGVAGGKGGGGAHFDASKLPDAPDSGVTKSTFILYVTFPSEHLFKRALNALTLGKRNETHGAKNATLDGSQYVTEWETLLNET